MANIHDSLSSSAFSVTDTDDYELVSVTSESDAHTLALNFQPLGLTAYHAAANFALPPLPPEPVPAPGCLEAFETARLTVEDIQGNVNQFIENAQDSNDNETVEEHCDRMDESVPMGGVQTYRINKPPKMRPVRVYIAALYDVLHPGHVLNLRQAKYSFPSVHLLVGVFAQAPPHSPAIFSHLERLETVRHIRYIDELIPEAPLELTEEFIREWNIDYVAYEEDTAWNDPGYQLARRLGKFLPLRSTGAITTGEVLQRLRGEQEKSERSSLCAHSREGTSTKNPVPQLNTDFTPLTPASYHDEDSPVAPEPNELLDPFTN